MQQKKHREKEERMSDTGIILYIPVLHRGYLELIRNNKHSTVYVLGEWIVEEIPYLKKEIRALSPKEVVTALKVLFPENKCVLLFKEHIKDASNLHETIILPNDDVSSYLVEMYLNKAKNIVFENIFLRWDRKNTKEYKDIVCEIVEPSEFMERARNLSLKSSDWWRQVGAVIVKDNQVLVEGYNTHLPHQHINYIQGDPRNTSHKGKDIELSSAIHAEAKAIATAAQRGMSLKGSTMYVTTFPCPVCAKLIAYSGIKSVVFSEGYAMLDAQDILTSFSITIQKENPR